MRNAVDTKHWLGLKKVVELGEKLENGPTSPCAALASGQFGFQTAQIPQDSIILLQGWVTLSETGPPCRVSKSCPMSDGLQGVGEAGPWL